jgi:hypothetical protein
MSSKYLLISMFHHLQTKPEGYFEVELSFKNAGQLDNVNAGVNLQVKMKKVPIWSRFPIGPEPKWLIYKDKNNLLPFHAKNGLSNIFKMRRYLKKRPFHPAHSKLKKTNFYPPSRTFHF